MFMVSLVVFFFQRARLSRDLEQASIFHDDCDEIDNLGVVDYDDHDGIDDGDNVDDNDGCDFGDHSNDRDFKI